MNNVFLDEIQVLAEMLMENPTLKFLSDIRYNLEYIDEELIKQSIADLRDKFAPVAILHKGHFIYRVRINRNGEIFTRKDQVNYITDQQTLDNHVIYGRANFPKQSVFYGAISTPKVNYPRATAYLETTDFFQSKPIPNDFTEIFTSTRWIIQEDIHVMEMIFSDDALKVSDYAQKSFEAQTSAIKDYKLKQHYIDQGRLFSNEFARNDCYKSPHNYKISSAYANYVWQQTDVKGVTFPSVRTDYQGQNVALLPEVVDKYLKLDMAAMFKFERINGQNIPINSIKIARGLGKDQMDFKWENYIGKEHQHFH